MRVLKNDWLKCRQSNPASTSPLICAGVLAYVLAMPSLLLGEESLGVKPLLPIRLSDVHAKLPLHTRVLIEATAIEEFLQQLDGSPPDWARVYGHGNHDPAHDERLFDLNRERDAKRAGNEALQWRIAFAWSGGLSTYDSESGGFRVVLGPRFTPTRWGLVRFKYNDLPGNLVAVPTSHQHEMLLRRITQGESIEIDVVMIGTLTPEESIVYDFSHEQEGLGLIMPVVRVEDIFYLGAPHSSTPVTAD